jgi:hypothetical protein
LDFKNRIFNGPLFGDSRVAETQLFRFDLAVIENLPAGQRLKPPDTSRWSEARPR